ncbi:hypothetical protein LSH36_146g03000 [Paralvinella palmiformis]|uniref:Transportin-3 n=1 Tax=Paralvinella palmiformis TaxID=53620 RepID=A0AAD9N7A8_9ANNE|nr:hypothetical protein LSH36_146g03000 [Paralvinella palmiformis]
MESLPSLETVFEALNALFHNPDTTGKEKASVWLGELQRSVFAWQISDQLLQLNRDVESCYFAAQTMRTKIQYAFHELPQDSWESLRDSLMNHCMKITQDTPHAITTQLCLALADLALQMSTWKGAASDLMQKFGNDVTHWHFLLELITVLPEEINSRSLRLGANRRNEVTEELVECCPVMVHLLTAILESGSTNSHLEAKVFRCLGSWFSVYAVPESVIINSKLLSSPFDALRNKDCESHLHEAATDCICAALYASEDITRNPTLVQALIQGVLTLLDPYHMSVATEDLDKSINYCRVFTEMAESLLDAILSSPNQGFGDLTTLELLLTCVGHHQYEVAEITFNFWYRLSEILYQRNEKPVDDIFKPYVQRLIVSLCKHCEYDSDHMFEALKASSTSWTASESALYVMTAVAKNIIRKPRSGALKEPVLLPYGCLSVFGRGEGGPWTWLSISDSRQLIYTCDI